MKTRRKRRVFRNLKDWGRGCQRLMRLIRELGVRGTLDYTKQLHTGLPGTTYPIKPQHARYPLYFRFGTSDLAVFQQIFLNLEYAPLCDLADVHLVIDCGANVGYSSAFFLSQFPLCHVVAIEPDPGNFALLQRNLAEYGERARVVRAGVWSHAVSLTLSRAALPRWPRMGRRGARVRENRPSVSADARYGYLRWGADGKVRQLDEMYPQLRAEEPPPARRARSARRSSISTSRP